MRKYSKILVIIEPQQDSQLALERACEIARYTTSTEITAFLAIYDFSYDITSILSRNEQNDMKNAIVKTNEDWLKEELPKYAHEHCHLTPKVVWQRNIAEAILKEAENGAYDLIIKGSDTHSFLDNVLFTPLDWLLLRNAKIPVLIAKDHPWPEGGAILVALNPDENTLEQKLLNTSLIRTAQALALLIKGSIHLTSAVPPLVPVAVMEVPGFSTEVYSDAVLKNAKEKILLAANKYRIPTENCHIEEGVPDDVIPATAIKLGACAVLIGNVCRKGWSAAIIGNTCEQIIDDVNCDLLVLRRD